MFFCPKGADHSSTGGLSAAHGGHGIRILVPDVDIPWPWMGELGTTLFFFGFNHPFGGAGFRWPIHSMKNHSFMED